MNRWWHKDDRVPAFARRLLGGWLLPFAMVLAGGDVAAAEPFVVAVVSEQAAARNQRVVDALQGTLDAACASPCPQAVDIRRIETDSLDTEPAADLLVGIGSRAAHRLAELRGDTPRLLAFIPRRTWQELGADCPGGQCRQSATFIDPAVALQLRLIRAIDPGARRVGVLLGPSVALTREELLADGELAGLDVEFGNVTGSVDVGSELRSLVDRSDALLALPDPEIYNRNTIYPILLSTYSAGIPVIGYSRSMVDAGAAASVFVTPEDAGRSIAEAIAAYRATARLPAPGFSTHYSISVNDSVIRSLRLPSADPDALRAALQERNP